MADFDWTGFSEEIGKVAQGIQSDIQQREDEKRAEVRQLRMAKEMQDLSLEGLNRKLEIEEPFKDRLNANLLERQKQLANHGQQLQKDYAMWSEKRNKELNIFAGSEGWAAAIERARKGKDLSEIDIMKMEAAIMEVRRGGLPDISSFEALTPFDRLPIMDLLKQNQIRTQQFKLQNDQAQKEMLQLTELIEYRKRQERMAGEREARMGAGAYEMSVQRWAAERTRLDTAVEKSATTFDKYRTELLTELEDTNKINEKGEAFAKIGGATKVSLLDDAGEVNEEAAKKFVKHYPRYRGRFDRLKELRENVKTRNERRDEFFGGEPAGGVAEVEVPEEEIKAAMEMGLTREQAIEQYKKFMSTKR